MSSHRTGLLKESEHSSLLSCTSIEIVCDFTLAIYGFDAAVNHKIANVKFIFTKILLCDFFAPRASSLSLDEIYVIAIYWIMMS